MVYRTLDKFNIINFSIAISVTHLHDLDIAVIVIWGVNMRILQDFEKTNVFYTLLQFFERKGSVLICVHFLKSFFEVLKLFLLNFEARED